MSRKKKFLALLAVCTVSLLLHHGYQNHWTMDAFHLGCMAIRSHRDPAMKPKHTNIVFLKTHKTASSTMQNMLFRFAETNNLTVALPINGCGHMFCYPKSFSSRFVHPHTLPANIVTNHMRYNRTNLKHIMPNDTVYVTILREPASMFESLFTYYYHNCQSFKRVPNGSLETFLKEPSRYYRPNETESMYAHNTLTFDLGGDKDRPAKDTSYAKAFTAEVERVFPLVMISEFFDESLVLLRHLLSWDLEDILYLKLNMRSESSKKSLTPALSAKIRAWNSIDAYLYDHFNATLWRKLTDFGLACVAKEVRYLRQAQEKLLKTCFGGKKPISRSAAKIKNKDLRPWQPSAKVDIVGYDLPENLSKNKKEFCLKYIMPEVSYSRMLLMNQMRRRQNCRKQLSQKLQSRQTPMRATSPQSLKVSQSCFSSIDTINSATGGQSKTSPKLETDNKKPQTRVIKTTEKR